MVVLDDLMAFLNDLMGDIGDKAPYMANGLHVRGNEEAKVLAAAWHSPCPVTSPQAHWAEATQAERSQR
jgi:hypothetical protein